MTPRSTRFTVDSMLDAMRMMTRLLAIYVSP